MGKTKIICTINFGLPVFQHLCETVVTSQDKQFWVTLPPAYC